MKKTALIAALALVVVAGCLAGCGEKATTTTNENMPATTAAAGSQAAPAASANAWTGTIVETMNSGGYTYVYLDTGSEKIWAAATETQVTVGQRVTVPKGMMMTNFPSKTLDRTFDEIYFVGGIYPEGSLPMGDGMAAGGMGGMGGMGNAPQDDNHAGMGGGTVSGTNTVVENAHVEGVAKAAGGYTVAEVFAQSGALQGKNVKVRGRVVKFTGNIMGTNWVHIQDGTEGDLTVTTSAVVATGDVVLVEGPLSVNKDFGAGYRYNAIIEKASVTKE